MKIIVSTVVAAMMDEVWLAYTTPDEIKLGKNWGKLQKNRGQTPIKNSFKPITQSIMLLLYIPKAAGPLSSHPAKRFQQ